MSNWWDWKKLVLLFSEVNRYNSEQLVSKNNASIAIGVDNRLYVSWRMLPTNLDVMI
jgi:hypothetical protein